MSNTAPAPTGQMLIYQTEDGRLKVEARPQRERSLFPPGDDG